MRSLKIFFPCLSQRDRLIASLDGHDSAPLAQHVDLANVHADVAAANDQTIEPNDICTAHGGGGAVGPTSTDDGYRSFEPSPRPNVVGDGQRTDINGSAGPSSAGKIKIEGIAGGGDGGGSSSKRKKSGRKERKKMNREMLARAEVAAAAARLIMEQEDQSKGRNNHTGEYVSPRDAATAANQAILHFESTAAASETPVVQPARRLFDTDAERSGKTAATRAKRPSPTSVMDIPTATPAKSRYFGECDETEARSTPAAAQTHVQREQSPAVHNTPVVSPMQAQQEGSPPTHPPDQRAGAKSTGTNRKLDVIDQILENTNCLSPETRDFVRRVEYEHREEQRRDQDEHSYSSPLHQQILTRGHVRMTPREERRKTRSRLLDVISRIAIRCDDLESTLHEKTIEVEKLKSLQSSAVKSSKAVGKGQLQDQSAIAQKVLAGNARRDAEQKEMEEVIEKLLTANTKLEIALEAMQDALESAVSSLKQMSLKHKAELNKLQEEHELLKGQQCAAHKMCQDMQTMISELAFESASSSLKQMSAKHEAEMNKLREEHESIVAEQCAAHSKVCQEMGTIISDLAKEVEELKISKHELELELGDTKEMLDEEAAKLGEETVRHVYEIMDLSKERDMRVGDLKKQRAELQKENEEKKLQIDELKMKLELVTADSDYQVKKMERTARKHRREIRSLTKESEERFFEVMVARGEEFEDTRASLQGMFDVEERSMGKPSVHKDMPALVPSDD